MSGHNLALAQFSEDIEAALDAFDRRVHTRLDPTQITWLKRVRLKYGPIVRVLDVSSGGLQIETTGHPLEPGSSLAIEIGREEDTLVMPASVVRCHVAAIFPQTIYRGAIAFKRLLDLSDTFQLAAAPVAADEPFVAPVPGPAVEMSEVPQGWHKLVVRYLDGRLLKGYGREFTASSSSLHVWPKPDAPAITRVTIPVWHLKAVFFVRDFTGDPNYVDTGAVMHRTHGRRVIVTFLDGETLAGSTLNYNQDASGFFLCPLDARDNNFRVYVVSRAIRHVQFV